MPITVSSGTGFTKANHSRTVLILVGVLCSLTVLAWVILSLIGGEVRRQITATLETTRAMAQSVGLSFIERQRDTTQVLADAPMLRAATIGLADGDESQRKIVTSRIEGILPFVGFDGWALATIDGRIFASGQRAAGWPVLPQSLHARIADVLAGKPILLPPTWVPEGQATRPAFLTASAVRDGEKTIAILVLTMDPGEQFSKELEAARFGNSGETYACTTEGWLASRSRFLDELKSSGLLPADAPTALLRLALRRPPVEVVGTATVEGNPASWPFTSAAAGIIAKTEGLSLDGYDYRGMPVVVAWGMLGDSGLGVITKIDRAEAFRPLTILWWIFGTMLSLLAIVAVAGTFWLGNLARLRHKLDKAKDQLQQLGQYTLEKKLGEGGMGAVYLGRHALMRRQTAIKLITGNVTAEALARFEREVQLSCTLSHPNTIAIYDYGRTADGTFYYAMELLDGMDLEAMVGGFGPLPPARVIHFLAQACGSLAEAHDLQMIHRDIKPANLFITKRGGERDVLKVLDFGLVKSIANSAPQLSRADVISGTPPYMAPEVIGQKAGVDGRSDLYALACVGYFLLTGKCPFERDTAMDTLMAHLNDPVPPLSQVSKLSVPADLEQVLMRALAKDPDQRQSSMRVLRDELLACSEARNWRSSDAEAWWAINGAKPVDRAMAVTAKMSPLPTLVVNTGDFKVTNPSQKVSRNIV